MGEDIFCIFLKRSNSDMSNSNYWKLMNEYRENAKVISILNLCYPSLLKNHKIFKYFANKSINIRDWFIYGIGNLFLFSSIFIIYLAWLVTTNQINYYILSESGESMYLLEWFNLILAIILASAFITLIIRWIIIKIVQERYILFYFSPKEPNNT